MCKNELCCLIVAFFASPEQTGCALRNALQKGRRSVQNKPASDAHLRMISSVDKQETLTLFFCSYHIFFTQERIIKA